MLLASLSMTLGNGRIPRAGFQPNLSGDEGGL